MASANLVVEEVYVIAEGWLILARHWLGLGMAQAPGVVFLLEKLFLPLSASVLLM